MSSDEHQGSLAAFGPAWTRVRILGDRLVLDNGEEYTLTELQALRWERNNWRTIAQATQRDLAKTGMQGAVAFPLEELNRIREALRLLDARLPGISMQIPQTSVRRRA